MSKWCKFWSRSIFFSSHFLLNCCTCWLMNPNSCMCLWHRSRSRWSFASWWTELNSTFYVLFKCVIATKDLAFFSITAFMRLFILVQHPVQCYVPTRSSLARSISWLLWMELWNFWWLLSCCSMAAWSSPQEAVSIRRWSTKHAETCILFIRIYERKTEEQLTHNSQKHICSVQICQLFFQTLAWYGYHVTSRWWQRNKLDQDCFFCEFMSLFTENISGIHQKKIGPRL